MTLTPMLAPPGAQPNPTPTNEQQTLAVDALGKPFRLSLIGAGASVGLFARLLAANGFGDLNSGLMTLTAAAASALVGLGLLLTAAQRDRFGPPLVWITLVTALAWGALNWISPPFHDTVNAWSNSDQAALALLGVGNGLLLAGILALGFVRRGPTLTVAATMVAGVTTLAANTILLRNEWSAIVTLGVTFAAVLLAWDRTPRHEMRFTSPEEAPRVSRAALSFAAVALCGTALQLWLSRSSIPRALPAVVLSVVLIGAAFASLMRVRREIERRETTLSEWTSWMREIRTNDFRAEMQNFEEPAVGSDGEPPRQLSFPNLTTADDLALDMPQYDEIDLDDPGAIEVETAEPPAITIPLADPAGTDADMLTAGDTMLPTPVSTVAPIGASGAFSSLLTGQAAEPETDTSVIEIADLSALDVWLASPAAAARVQPLLVAIEAMSLEEFESLPPADAAVAREEIGAFLADIMPNADLVSWIDGPYFIVAHADAPNAELSALNTSIRKLLKSTDGTLAFLRPGRDAVLDEIVDEAVMGLLTARRNQIASSL